MKMFFRTAVTFFALSLVAIACSPSDASLSVYVNSTSDNIDFAIAEIEKATGREATITTKEDKASICFVVDEALQEINEEGFHLEKNPSGKLKISASSVAGAMYGGLELAEQIQLYGLDDIKDVVQNPYMELRGAKFNIPLDARSPSYTDASDVAQHNMEDMWNFDFWTEYLDNMARYRYNFISFWSLHPFPSMIKLEDYPDVALDDVHKSTVDWDEHYHLHGTGLDAPEILNNYEVIKKISIDEKIAFWKKVMAYGKSRNVDMYFITWNIFTNGTFGKYGITDDVNNATTKDYFRKSVKEMFMTYPDLAGIGLTTGENMPGVKFAEKEQWAYDTYAEGILDAAAALPERDFTFIHRQHQADPAAVEKMFQPLIKHKNIEFIYSFKYAKAHVFSCTKQPYHEKFEQNIGELKTIWTLRNDDAYLYRWGSPIYTREFIKNIPHAISRGVYYGSDQWVWGREFTTKKVEGVRELEVTKHWYHWMMWGRLSYNPEMGDERFEGLLKLRFPETDAATLFRAWHEASMVYPITTGFHWGPVDFKWYIEGCRSRPQQANNETGFHDIHTFINIPPHVYTGYQSIPDYVKGLSANKQSDLRSPLQVAQLLHDHSDKANALVATLENANNSKELTRTLHDISTIAAMGKYYAHKIAGATHYAVFQNTGSADDQKKAVDELTLAYESWKHFAALSTAQNIEQIWTNRVGYVNWNKTSQWVKEDIAIAKQE